MDLNEVAKKDQRWRSYALKISGDPFLADDLVQDMYLKIQNINREVNDFYIILIIKSIFIDLKRKKKFVFCVEDGYLQKLHEEIQPDEMFEVNDQQKEIIEEYNKLPFHQRELILESYFKSLRQIESEFNINYGYIHRELKKARKKLLK